MARDTAGLTLRGAPAIHQGIHETFDDSAFGPSSRSPLSRRTIDTLRIDASFVGRIGEEHVSAGVLDAITPLAHMLEVEMIAEGIEIQEQRSPRVSRGVPDRRG